jgi:hypothetical protein
LDINAVSTVLGFVETRQRFSGDASQHPVHRFQNRHMLAELAEHCCRFEPDVAPTDHNDLLCLSGFSHHAVRIGAGTDTVDALQIMTGAGELPRSAACRPDQLAIANRRTVGERDLVRKWIDRGHTMFE